MSAERSLSPQASFAESDVVVMNASYCSAVSCTSAASFVSAHSAVSGAPSSVAASAPITTETPFDCTEVLAALLTSVLEERCETEPATVYDSKQIVAISMNAYLSRWMKLTQSEGSVPIAAACLLDRMIARTGLTLTSYNIHRVVLAALVVSHKLILDVPFTNAHFARVGGVSLQEVNRLEATFLLDMDWELTIEAEEHARYKGYFQRHHSKLVNEAM